MGKRARGVAQGASGEAVPGHGISRLDGIRQIGKVTVPYFLPVLVWHVRSLGFTYWMVYDWDGYVMGGGSSRDGRLFQAQDVALGRAKT